MPRFSSARLRRLVQFCFVLFLSWTVWRLYGYAQWMAGNGGFVPRPPAAEAVLPLSALLGLKRFVLTGQYDPVHPAGLTILLVALGTAVLCRRGFCGCLCPVGWLSGQLARLGTRLGVSFRPGKWGDRLLSAPKYLLLALILYAFVLNMGLQETEWFLNSPYNHLADIKMLEYFLHPGTATLAILLIMAVGSIFLPGFWCRGFCPYGALLGLLSLASPAAVNRDAAACIGCGRCSAACPSRVNSHITSSPRIVFEGGSLDGNVHIRTERTLQRVGDVRRRGNSHMPAASTRRQCRDPCGHQPFPMPTALTASPRRGATSGAQASVPLARVAFAWRGPQRRSGPAVRVRRFPGTESAGP